MTKIRKKNGMRSSGYSSRADMPKRRKSGKSAPLVEVTGSSRGPGSNELTSVALNNEVPFCRVGSLKAKEAVERVLLNNRISYFVKWKEQSFFARLFGNSKESVVFIIFIHDTMLVKARSLVKGMKGVKLLSAR